MIKSDLIDSLYDNFQGDVTKAKCAQAVNCVFGKMVEVLKKSEPVTLQGFGTFKVQGTSSRTGRNPRTGEKIVIPAGKKVKFTSSRALKDSIQG